MGIKVEQGGQCVRIGNVDLAEGAGAIGCAADDAAMAGLAVAAEDDAVGFQCRRAHVAAIIGRQLAARIFSNVLHALVQHQPGRFGGAVADHQGMVLGDIAALAIEQRLIGGPITQ